jgi:hypothetical protein
LSEARLATLAGGPALKLGHVVHGFTAKIDQITAKRTKGIKKFGVAQGRKGAKKCLPDGAIES